jgi:hypothetical protein
MGKDFDGTTLTQCFDVVAKCGGELEAMCSTLTELFSNALPAAEAKWVGDASSDTRPDGSGWVSIDYLWWLPIGPKKSSTKKMYLGYQISLMGDGVAIPGIPAQEPLIHVFLWSSVPSFENEYYLGFPFEADQGLVGTENGLIEWNVGEGYEWSGRPTIWTFSIKLFTLNSREDLLQYVVNPAVGLLNGKNVSVALPDSIPGLVRYTNEQFGISNVPIQDA